MYAKVFTSMWDGSLYGKLEASAVLMACVTLCNAQGVLDMTPEAISGRTGWPIEFVRQGIHDLQQPDPRSRTPDDEGRRLALLDEHRDWGWVIVNYEKYRTLSDPDTIKEQNKIRARKYRERRHAPSRSVTQGNDQSRHAEAEALSIKNTVESEPSTSIEKVFEHWKREWKHANAKLDGKRTKAIREALKSYPLETLCKAITGYKNSPHHMGNNERKTVYDDIELFLRDAKHIEVGLKFAENETVTWR